MKFFIGLICIFTIPGHFHAHAAPNLYQTLEEVDQFDILKLNSIKGREATVQMPVDSSLDPLNQIFHILDAKLSKSLGTIKVLKVVNQKTRTYSGTWTSEKTNRLRPEAMKNLYGVMQKEEFLSKVSPHSRSDRAAIVSALQNRFSAVKINLNVSQNVPWLPGKSINPIVDVRYGISQHRFNTASLLIDSSREFKPNASSLYFEGFIPHHRRYPWLNMIGFGLTYTQVDKFNVNYQNASGAGSTKVTINNDQSDFRILVAPRFELPIPYRILLGVSLYNQDHSEIEAELQGSPLVQYAVDRVGYRVELGFDAVFLKYGRVGYRYALPMEQDVKIKTTQNEVSSQEKGTSRNSAHKLSIGAQYPWLPSHLYVPTVDFFWLAQEESYSFESTNIKDQSFSQKLYGGSLGISIFLNI